MTLNNTTLADSAESRHAEFRLLFLVTLNVIMLSVVAPSTLDCLTHLRNLTLF
jgi:hypothetical protein